MKGQWTNPPQLQVRAAEAGKVGKSGWKGTDGRKGLRHLAATSVGDGEGEARHPNPPALGRAVFIFK